MQRAIIHIDEEKCDGCGQCVPACHEGALAIVKGKARLVSEVLCDGLGACLGECPQGAIVVEQREAPAFDEAAVARHLGARPAAVRSPAPLRMHPPHGHAGGGCPGSAHRMMAPAAAASAAEAQEGQSPTQLRHWPVQLMLVAPGAPFLRGADLLVCADCVPFAVGDFHERYLKGRAVVVGCPKLDDLGFYREKLEVILRQARPRSLTVLRMEVPCCGGIAQAAIDAQRAVAPDLPVRVDVIGVDGSVAGS